MNKQDLRSAASKKFTWLQGCSKERQGFVRPAFSGVYTAILPN